MDEDTLVEHVELRFMADLEAGGFNHLLKEQVRAVLLEIFGAEQ
jgi:hypothetical protein